MHIDFNKEMRQNSQQRIPELVIKHMSENLPEGIHYEMNQDGSLSIKSDTNAMTIGGLELNNPDEIEEKIGPNLTQADVLNYSYNAQKKLSFKPEKEGYLKINGDYMPINKIKIDLFHKIESKSTEIFLVPNKFPPLNDICLGCKEYNRSLHIHRIPNESINDISIQSDDKEPLRITLILNSQKESVTINLFADLKYAKTVRDIVETVYIFNAFIDGNGMINGKGFPNEGGKKGKKFSENCLRFWRKVLYVEDKLNSLMGISFLPSSYQEIDEGTVRIIEELYQTLVLNEPVRKPNYVTSITGSADIAKETNLDDLVGEKIFWMYTSEKIFEIFGTQVKVLALNGISEIEISNYEIDNNQVTLFFKETKEKSYVSTMDFLQEKDLGNYQKEHEDSLEDIFSEAKLLDDLINKALAG